MKEDYLLSVKKAIVDFVLRDPREKDEEKKVDLPSHREELAVVPKPWYRSFLGSWNEARENLHTTNPCMNQILDLWHSSFGYAEHIYVGMMCYPCHSATCIFSKQNAYQPISFFS